MTVFANGNPMETAAQSLNQQIPKTQSLGKALTIRLSGVFTPCVSSSLPCSCAVTKNKEAGRLLHHPAPYYILCVVEISIHDLCAKTPDVWVGREVRLIDASSVNDNAVMGKLAVQESIYQFNVQVGQSTCVTILDIAYIAGGNLVSTNVFHFIQCFECSTIYSQSAAVSMM